MKDLFEQIYQLCRGSDIVHSDGEENFYFSVGLALRAVGSLTSCSTLLSPAIILFAAYSLILSFPSMLSRSLPLGSPCYAKLINKIFFLSWKFQETCTLRKTDSAPILDSSVCGALL